MNSYPHLHEYNRPVVTGLDGRAGELAYVKCPVHSATGQMPKPLNGSEAPFPFAIRKIFVIV